MTTIFGIPTALLFGQLLLGIINGAFYATLSLGLAVIFGMMNIANFAHGALYMMGAVGAWFLLNTLGIGYWPALLLCPLIVGIVGVIIERFILRRVSHIDHLYGMLLTFGLALIIQGMFRFWFGASGLPYAIPAELNGGMNLGFMFLPYYRAWVVIASIAVCFATWFVIEKTRLGAHLRAATENPNLVQAFGINVPLMIMLVYGGGAALAAFAGVLAAPILQVSPTMGADILIVIFAVVVIGGLGSIKGAIIAGFSAGILEGLTKAFYPEASTTVVFVLMALVLLVKPTGLFGAKTQSASTSVALPALARETPFTRWVLFGAMAIGLALAPVFVYPAFLMKAMTYGLFACAFNLMAGYGKLVSFGHAMFLGTAGYVTAYTAKTLGFSPELAILAGTGCATLLGLVSGWLCTRSSGVYFAMISLALAQTIYFVALQLPQTGGEDGITSVPRGALFGLFDLGNPTTLYIFVLAVFLGGFLFLSGLIRSPFGQVLKAIRDHEPRAQSLGFSTERYKLAAFVISATLSGLAGSTKVIVTQIASLTDVHWTMSGEVILMTFLGGVGTLYGPVLGAFIVVAMQNYLAAFGAWVTIIQGGVFVLGILAFRRGIVGELISWLSSRERKKTTAPSLVSGKAAQSA
ncbi:ABC transporter permease [Falsochrobactrum sp. TDYN1]|uniref:ABC transporter permease n=2 Tax=Falsochrobactrum tianjinense TaxID=2706015 RepID=A0A949USY8_9HYPH|nr:ABC transporter permease [Falsochrobactrum sp. TDYN1]MBV2142122.1 ABC transporter permease [Falsochrobactrum sp. TDYN1]